MSELPPMPAPRVPKDKDTSTWDKFSAEQMQAYARAAVAAQPEAGEAVDEREALLRECADYLAELYAKYQTRIGPFASQGQKLNARIGSLLASAPTIQPTQPVQEAAPAKWRELLTEIADSCAGYEVRVGKKVNGDWLARARELLAATPAQAGDAGEPSDGERLDWLEQVGTANIQRMRRLDPKAAKYWDIEFGNDERTASGPNLRTAIDTAMSATKDQP